MATAPTFDMTQPCFNLDPQIFFPDLEEEIEKGTPKKEAERIYQEKVNVAKEICSTCKFVSECLEYALKTNAYGIWGATNELDRRRIKKQKYRAKQKSTP